jgi:diacylglycerol kinase family enzyme
MYYYIVDPQQLSQKEFERVQNNLYSSLSEFRISGEVVRMTGLRTIQQLVENAFAHEAKTIIAVGGDDTLHEVINAIGKREMVVGFIPIIESEMAEIFGLKDLLQAVKTIAFRRIEQIDLGVVNGNDYFLSKLTIETNDEIELIFKVDDKYTAKQTVASGLIVNSRVDREGSKVGNPTDGLLDLLLLPKLTKWKELLNRKLLQSGIYETIHSSSTLHVKSILIKNSGLPLKVGNKILAKTPAEVTVAVQALKLIVGRERNF